ncbi:maleylpyruvate isomerase family mycothiol-dependent enzyme [uncultured Mycolicibacterium sp.]|uniref:maleylpyruvate isomerase family mycothiol-dependent enzyme n=1 Tax=uncultured Mycolicibacterium sp. TaxID=2320817 RepID=UPI00262D68D5|nr:maleylpyruvate isomerase family mycothiol-dependent enzyme [uncultured Mycolicibacterium sp.]
MDLTATTAAAVTEATAFADLLDGLDPDSWTAPTPCTDWTVAGLAQHVARGLARDAEAFHRARLGSTTPPGEIAFRDEDLADAIRLSADHLRAAVAAGPPDWPPVGLPFGRYPADAGMQCLVVEFGVHRNDLARAVKDPTVPFSAATRTALFGFGALYLLRQAEPVGTPVCFVVEAPSVRMAVTHDGRRWRAGTGDAPRCVVRTDDDTAARLILRRCEITDPAIELDDPAGLAGLFATAIRPL